MPIIGKRILLVDDDLQLVTLLTLKLTQLGYTVDAETRPDEGFRRAQANEYDVIVLDVVMPRQSGLDVCVSLRRCGILTPVLMLSGKTEKESIIQCLNAGADDYLTKPFSQRELVARIKALVRRNQKAFNAQLLERYGFSLDIESGVAQFGTDSIVLTKKETLLLKRLMADAPKPVPRFALLQDVWWIGDAHASNRLDVYVRRLRKKLAVLTGDPCIQTIRGRGYYFAKPERAMV